MSSLKIKILKTLYFILILAITGFVLKNLIDLKLVYHNQQPIFFTDFETFLNAFSIPGGFTDYLGSLFSVLYYFPFLGLLTTALIIAIIPVYVYIDLKNTNHTYALIIGAAIWIITLLNFTDYSFKLSTLWVLICSLPFLNLLKYILRKVNNHIQQISLTILVLIMDFIVTGGPGLMFTYALFIPIVIKQKELVFNKKTVLLIAGFVITVLLPYLSVMTIFKSIPLNSIYFGNFINDAYYTNPVFIYALSSIVILSEILALLFVLVKIPGSKVFNYIVCIIFLPLIYFLPSELINKVNKKKVKIDYYAYEQEWDKVIREADIKLLNDDYIINFQVNRALYHTGNMLDKLCAMPQKYGADALLIEHYNNSMVLIPTSDIYYDMGMLNESRHWASEAYTSYGKQPRILRRLVQVNIVYQKYNTAKKYILLLKKTIVNKKWAEQQEEFLFNESKIAQNSEYNEKRNQFVSYDFFSNQHNPVQNLLLLLQQPGSHKMAFEYLISYYLLKHELTSIINSIPEFKKYGYKDLPKLVQESILLYIISSNKKSIMVTGYSLSKEIDKNFTEYKKILMTSKMNAIAAKATLDKQFSDTYWYYIQYKSPITKNSGN